MGYKVNRYNPIDNNPNLAARIGYPIFTGEIPTMKNRPSVQDYATRIQANWQRVTNSIFAVADLCAKANEQLLPDEKKKLIGLLPFSGPTFSKLAQIGADKRLHGPVQKQLPPSYSIIYSVTQLNDKQLQAAVTDEIISPKLKRAELARWLGGNDRRNAPSITLPSIFYAAIHLLRPLSADEAQRLDLLLDQIRDEFGTEIVKPRIGKKKAHNDPVFEHVRKKALKFIAKRKKRKLRGVPKKYWKERWFKEDEVAIPPDSNLQRVREALAIMNDEDQYDKFLSEAREAIPFPEPPPVYQPDTDQNAAIDLNATYNDPKKRIRTTKTKHKKIDFSDFI